MSFSVLFVCKCVLYYCHRVATQLQLNTSYIVSSWGASLCLCIFIYFCPSRSICMFLGHSMCILMFLYTFPSILMFLGQSICIVMFLCPFPEYLHVFSVVPRVSLCFSAISCVSLCFTIYFGYRLDNISLWSQATTSTSLSYIPCIYIYIYIYIYSFISTQPLGRF